MDLRYFLGMICAAQLWNYIFKKNPQISSQFRNGNFDLLYSTVKNLVFRHGKIYPPLVLIKKATSESLSTNYFVDFLEKRYLSENDTN
ncbi:MAG: hypothetical protein BAJALOKI1v1_1160002 [Promethearchaeota archaeon]|nr:MAG: hypothetical protein BAJALOKI1v1_1160002 [Candidatus Lokiarchaeota archaeon]